MPTDQQDAYRSVVVAIFCGGLYLLADAISRILIQQALFELWFRYKTVVAPPLALWVR